jgi:hypothetical protein
MSKPIGIALCAALLLASCSKPDASGIYLTASDRKVIMVQIIQTKDDVLTGRAEEVSVDSSGNVKDRSLPLDGAISEHDLLFKPSSAWFGGLQATGTVNGDHLTLTGNGTQVEADRSDLDKYRAAVARLQAVAAQDRQQIADARQAQAQQAAQMKAIKAVADKIVALQKAMEQLQSDTTKMNAGLANSPNFTERSATNTARITKLAQIASTVSGVRKSQLVVDANQIEIDTNQIEIARSQYAIELNQIVFDAKPVAEQVLRFCNSAQNAQFAKPCGPATAAATEFQSSLAKGQKEFGAYKQGVQNELNRQSALIHQMSIGN